MGIMILDIDHFKEYNDTFGHQVGDRALQSIARCLQQERRTSDVVARIGGEEFALILPETDIQGAVYVAEKIRAAIHLAGTGLKRALTISIGISILNGTDIDSEMLIQQADLALYEAKGKGRDQICVFNATR